MPRRYHYSYVNRLYRPFFRNMLFVISVLLAFFLGYVSCFYPHHFSLFHLNLLSRSCVLFPFSVCFNLVCSILAYFLDQVLILILIFILALVLVFVLLFLLSGNYKTVLPDHVFQSSCSENCFLWILSNWLLFLTLDTQTSCANEPYFRILSP